MTIDKREFNIDELEPKLAFVHGVLQLLTDALQNDGFDGLERGSLVWVVMEAEHRCSDVIGMFMDGVDIELQGYYNNSPRRING